MATIPTNYAGTDVGYAVIGIGSSTHHYIKYNTYRFEFRRVGEKHKGWFEYFTLRGLPFSSVRTDYKSSDEAGVVEIAALPPGHYEVVNFLVSKDWLDFCSSDQDFSIPFEIKPG